VVGEVIGEVLPVAVGAAISPVPIIPVIDGPTGSGASVSAAVMTMLPWSSTSPSSARAQQGFEA
jgi:hypothetical protein